MIVLIVIDNNLESKLVRVGLKFASLQVFVTFHGQTKS